MKKIKVAELKDGDKFTESIYMDEKLSNMLVPADTSMKAKDLERIVKWGISEVFTTGELIKDAQKKEEPAAIANITDAADSKFFITYASMIELFSDIMNALKKGKKPNAAVINEIADQLTEMVESAGDIKDIDELVGYINKSDKLGEKYAVSGINCAILSIIVGKELKLTPIRMNNLVIASLLHDVGMLRIPERILEKKGNLTPEELAVVRMHPTVSYQIIAKILGFPEGIARIVIQHHERWDGNGYPSKLAGEQINLLARIIAVTDSFEAMNRSKAYRTSMIGYAAMKQILNENSKKYDAGVVKVLVKVLGIYPPGSFVILNDTSIGKVVKVKSTAPLRPVIKLLIDSTGAKVEKNEEIDLVANTKLFIVKVIDVSEMEGKLSD
ncbi:MAG: HD-GYP domain-containing protein [Spirochaetes bacterium]|nr:HD-GYP domain-containing protein [Spirochaetota bacterium]